MYLTQVEDIKQTEQLVSGWPVTLWYTAYVRGVLKQGSNMRKATRQKPNLVKESNDHWLDNPGKSKTPVQTKFTEITVKNEKMSYSYF